MLVGYLVLVFGGIPVLQATWGDLPYLAYTLLLTVALVAICWMKGEPPRWRWG